MGVPKFFRWVAERYPMVITPFKDSPPPVDNLYLDMNGIIHNCTHPNDIDAKRKAPSEIEMVQAMFGYLEKLFTAIQPKKYFVMAVDGVAPRAKMNQQRQRRYRAGYEMMVAREEALAKGEEIPEQDDVFDSNCITPGTEFMVRIQEHFEYFITMKLQTDSAWQNCKVIFSGQDHPGEGEHKIVEFIRRRKMQDDYSPNETHCMYGLDADLVMLALATHEPRFVLLREVVSFGTTHASRKERERAEEDAAKGIKEDTSFAKPDEFVLFHINVLREYLEIDIKSGLETLPVNYDFERVVDDFVFMCIFVGNDFLPSIPTLGINDGSMLTMLQLYREHVLKKGTYLTRDAKANWNSVEIFLAKLGELELDTLRARQDEEAEYQKRAARHNRDHEVKHSIIPVTSIVEYKEKYYTEKHEFADGWKPRGADMKELTMHYIEGIMWVMGYYYQGPPSWKWYFPHHYAPLASDLVNLSALASRVRFDRGTPFLPHQQLLAVLPPMSYKSMPRAYWPLLRGSNSPLHEYFPEHLKIDKEGARAPWEGVVLIPFMDEKTLVTSYMSVQQDVGPEDAAKNVLREPVKFEKNVKIKPYTLQSTMFAPMHNVLVSRSRFPFPEADTFIAQLCPNVRIHEKEIEGFSSLNAKSKFMSPVYEVGTVTIFGNPTKRESMILRIEDENAPENAEDVYHLIGQEVLVGYPHHKRARISSVADRKMTLSAQWDSNGVMTGVNAVEHNSEAAMNFRKECETHTNFLKAKVGIALPSVDILVYVHRFVGMRITRKGRVLRQFSKNETSYPVQLTTRLDQIDMMVDPRYVERDRDEFDCSDGAQTLYTGPEPANNSGKAASVFGTVGYVMEQDSEFFTIMLRVRQQEQSIPQSLARFATSANWMSLHHAAERVRVSPLALTMLCSSMTTSAQFGSQELGLCLKFTGKNLARVGYAKLVQTHYNPWYVGASNIFEKMEADEQDAGHHLQHANTKKGDFLGRSSANQSGKGTWYFSEIAVKLIEDYVERFTPLVKRLETGGANSHALEPQEFMTGKWADVEAKTILENVEKFLAEHGCSDKPMIPASEDSFAREHLVELEEHLEATSKNIGVKEQVMKRVLKRNLYFPNVRTADGFTMAVPLPKEQKYQIGSRVVCCRTTGAVPFGATATITRIVNGQNAEIICDQPFTGGSKLNGRIKTNRGAIVKLASLLVTQALGDTGNEQDKEKTFFAKPAPLALVDPASGARVGSPASVTAGLEIPKPKSHGHHTTSAGTVAASASAAEGVDLAAFHKKLQSEVNTRNQNMSGSSSPIPEASGGGVNLAALAARMPGLSPPVVEQQKGSAFPINPSTAGAASAANIERDIVARQQQQQQMHKTPAPAAPATSNIPKPRSKQSNAPAPPVAAGAAVSPPSVVHQHVNPTAPGALGAAQLPQGMANEQVTQVGAYKVVGALNEHNVKDIFTQMVADKLKAKLAASEPAQHSNHHSRHRQQQRQ